MKKQKPHKQYDVEEISQGDFEKLLGTWDIVGHQGKIVHLEKMSKNDMLKRKLIKVVE